MLKQLKRDIDFISHVPDNVCNYEDKLFSLELEDYL